MLPALSVTEVIVDVASFQPTATMLSVPRGLRRGVGHGHGASGWSAVSPSSLGRRSASRDGVGDGVGRRVGLIGARYDDRVLLRACRRTTRRTCTSMLPALWFRASMVWLKPTNVS